MELLYQRFVYGLICRHADLPQNAAIIYVGAGHPLLLPCPPLGRETFLAEPKPFRSRRHRLAVWIKLRDHGLVQVKEDSLNRAHFTLPV